MTYLGHGPLLLAELTRLSALVASVAAGVDFYKALPLLALMAASPLPLATGCCLLFLPLLLTVPFPHPHLPPLAIVAYLPSSADVPYYSNCCSSPPATYAAAKRSLVIAAAPAPAIVSQSRRLSLLPNRSSTYTEIVSKGYRLLLSAVSSSSSSQRLLLQEASFDT
ncbi:hypothetical protein B296_00005534 [Ensete ventricosum]|uniref:Uncharacterized protein n=1 Tax=Ensete ventricosum TaxID=4639 RepID=A0A427ALR1_ENSVE|nr:hypothetical protein B296_00005534 [Ensete ventricosum]